MRWPLAMALLFVAAGCAVAAPAPTNITLPDINIGTKTGEVQDLVLPFQLLMFMTVLSLAPYILVMTTSFIRITIVLSFLRTAMGTQQVPPTQVLMGLALFMTFYVMNPVITKINDTAVRPLYEKKIKQAEFIEKVQIPIKEFMYANCRPTDIKLFLKFANLQQVKINKPTDVPIHVMLPAFVVSEIKTAFAIGFLLYIPFLVIDMVVASVLMSMGMFMLSPMSISLPFKLLLFVMINGWELIITSLITSFKRPQ